MQNYHKFLNTRWGFTQLDVNTKFRNVNIEAEDGKWHDSIFKPEIKDAEPEEGNKKKNSFNLILVICCILNINHIRTNYD